MTHAIHWEYWAEANAGDDDDLANIHRQEAQACGDDGPDLEQDAMGDWVPADTVHGPWPARPETAAPPAVDVPF